MYKSIVWSEEDERKETDELTSCIEDLNLDQVISNITNFYQEYKLKDIYQSLPGVMTKQRRQAVLSDIEDQKLFAVIKNFMISYHALCERMSFQEACRYEYQCKRQSIDNFVYAYDMLQNLSQALKDEDDLSDELLELNTYIENELFNKQYMTLVKESKDILKEFEQMQISLSFEDKGVSSTQGLFGQGKSKVRVLTESMDQNYVDDIITKLGLGQELSESDMCPFQETKEINELERNILRILRKSNPKPFEHMERFVKNSLNVNMDVLKQMVNEFAFYISYIEFERRMEEKGFQLERPDHQEDKFEIIDGYDLALALHSIDSGEKIVPNSCEYNNGEKFFIVTGPNQGGKTTFARMLGQEVYFAQMGLKVPAAKAKIPEFTRIASHFACEEAVEIGAGKLKEELLRLKPIMDYIRSEHRGRTFVIINELFTTAATYDAMVMGQRVIEDLCSQDCYGVYVTHVQELAKVRADSVSLVAEVCDDEKKTRTYKILRSTAKPAQAQSVAYKYGMTYEQLVRRMPK